MCQFDLALGCPDHRLNIILGVCEGVSGRNIGIGGPSKADGSLQRGWASSNLLGASIEQKGRREPSLVVQWSRLHAPNVGGGACSIPGWGAKIPHTSAKPMHHNY